MCLIGDKLLRLAAWMNLGMGRREKHSASTPKQEGRPAVVAASLPRIGTPRGHAECLRSAASRHYCTVIWRALVLTFGFFERWIVGPNLLVLQS